MNNSIESSSGISVPSLDIESAALNLVESPIFQELGESISEAMVMVWELRSEIF